MSSLKRYIITLKMYFNYLCNNDNLKIPFDKYIINIKNEKRIPKIIKNSEIIMILDTIKDKYKDCKTNYDYFKYYRD